MRKILFVLLILLSSSAIAQCPIIPTPSGYAPMSGHYIVPDTLSINAPDLMPDTYDYLKKELASHSIALFRALETAELNILKLNTGTEFGYEMRIADNILINHKSDEGAFYAVNSLLQMILDKDGDKVIQKCRINDEPRFNWRGLHLDVSRHFFSVEEVKHFIDLMALYKFNKFHWHLTDDQGWRIEIKKYPKLATVGGFRDSTVIGHFSDEPRKYDTDRYGGFYTQEEVKDVVAYAASKYIDVVPEIEMPGHSRAALAAYPEYSCNGELQEVPGLWGIFDDIYCSKAETIEFMKDILSEVLDLFPSEYIHIGGDEAPKVRWKECDDCQKVIKDNSLKDEHELQSFFIRQIDEFLTAKNRKLIGWDEILEGGLSPNAAVMSWRGEAGGIEAAKQGHYVVMSPTTYCYFDYYQSSHDIEPLAIGGYLPLEKVYKYNPVPEELSKEQEKYILGGQANLWTEYMGTMDHVEYMAFPRALALIQSLWCINKPEYKEFLEVYLAHHEDYLGRHDANFAKSIHYPDIKIERAKGGINVRFEGVKENTKFHIERFEKNHIIGGERRTDYDVTADTELFISRSSDPNEIIEFDLTSSEFEETVHYRFKVHSELGLPITLVTPAHPKYNNNGSLNLVDGIHSGDTFKGSEWLGFREDEVVMIIDLESVKDFRGVQMGLKESNGSWIYLPESIMVEVSSNNKDWKEVSDKSIEDCVMKGDEYFVECNSAGRYIKVTLKSIGIIPNGMGGAGNIPWTFIDEIEILYRNE